MGRERAASRVKITIAPAISIGSPLFPSLPMSPENSVIPSASEGSYRDEYKTVKEFSHCLFFLLTFCQKVPPNRD
jgi:hypothetical protein